MFITRMKLTADERDWILDDLFGAFWGPFWLVFTEADVLVEKGSSL